MNPVLLTLSTTHEPATDLGFLLHKHPERFQSFDLSFGQAHVFYPESTATRCTACLMLEVDAVGMVRGKGVNENFLLGQYVNDRPYVASSFMSVAIAQVFSSALQGRCRDRPEAADRSIPLVAKIEAIAVRGGEAFVRAVFEPLGYEVEVLGRPLDEKFPNWGESHVLTVVVRATKTLREVLSHLYVLIPVFDARKHYFVGEDEIEKLLEKGKDWLADHPAKDEIVRRYLQRLPKLYRSAIARLEPTVDPDEDEKEAAEDGVAEESLEAPLSLNDQRHMAVIAALRSCGARSVLDLGCNEGKLLRRLIKDKAFTRIFGVDVSLRALEIASQRLRLDRSPNERVQLLHGSLMYRDRRLSGFDAAAVVEVIEHFDPPRLAAFERVLFEFARPTTVVVTTPNREYNVVWEALAEGRLRHSDHRFEWSRQEFRAWATRIAAKYGYSVKFSPVGPLHEEFGPPTQMAVFTAETSIGSMNPPVMENDSLP